MTYSRAACGHFVRDTQGTVAVIFGLMLTVICGMVALAVDLSRSYSVSSRLAVTLDAAALAGAKMLDMDQASDADIRDRVTAFVTAQAPILAIPPSVTANLSVQIDRANNKVTAASSGPMETTFAKVIGFSTVTIGKTASVVYKMRDVELALVLDVTGSMGDVPAGDTVAKIDSLKSVAQSVVDTLYSKAINERGIRVAMIPYSSSVNAGDYGSLVLPSDPNKNKKNLYFTSYSGGSGYGDCVVERLGSNTTTDAAPNGSDALRALVTVGGMGNTCPDASVIPLMGRSQQSEINDTIANLAPSGSTAGHIGAAWGWYTLSPNWSGIFTGAQAPGAYNDTNVSKNFVLMTDGLFNTSYLTGLAPGTAAATTESYAQFDAICAGMKAQGINVYTIGFGLDDPTAAMKLSKCASSASNFFPVANGSELATAFGTIVAKLNSLRLTR